MRDSAFQDWLNKKRGNQTKLADGLGITISAITQWKRVPVDKVLEVARITKISRTRLRPDIYRPSAKRVAARQ